MAFGTWRSPFPFQFGGGSTRRISKLYDALKPNLGDAITTEQGTIAGGEVVAMARLLSLADRAVGRRVRQGQDPRTLTEPRLSRWEEILGITRSVNDSDNQRRRRVAAKLLSTFDAGSGSISRIASEAFAPWSVQVRYGDADTSTSYWPGGSSPVASAWYSTVALIAVEFIRPMGASDADADARVAACVSVLDDTLPGWATFNVSETFEGNDFGFTLDVSRLDATAFGD